MAPDDTNNLNDEFAVDLDDAIDAAADLTGPAGDESAVDLEEVLNSHSADEAGGPDGPRPYDFNRPHNISRAFEQNLQAVGEGFAKIAAIDFTSLLRTIAQIEYRGLHMTTYGDFQANLPNPTCAAMVSLEPLKGVSVLHLDIGLCFLFMQKLMGGAIEADAPDRDFTEIERGINTGLVERFLHVLRKSTRDRVELSPACVKLENNPGYLSGLADGESLIVLRFSLQVGSVEGPAELAIPMAAFGPVREIFDPSESTELRTPLELRDDRRRILGMVQGTTSEVVVELGGMGTSLEEILGLAEGDVLKLPQAVSSPLKVRIGGEEAWLGQAGRLGRNRAVQLTRQLNKE